MGIFNCDWFSFTADFSHYNATDLADRKDTYDVESNKHLARLFSRLDEEREKADCSGFIDLGLWKFQVMNHGNRQYYYLLHNDDMEIRLARWRSKAEERFPVYVHFKSQFLWAEIYSVSSLMDKFLLVMEWLEDVLNGKYLASKINRLDLAYHTDDVPRGFNTEQFVGRHTTDNTWRTHRVVNAVEIGSRKSEQIFLRCYNKFLEARSKKKTWFFPIWENARLDIRKVWNIEFQMKREFFTDNKIDKRYLDSCEHIIESQETIWKYLTLQWVTYRIPDNERRTRWSVHPWWTEMANNFMECTGKIDRGRQRELPTAEMLIPAIRGFLSSYAARMGGNLEDGTLFKRLLTDIKEYEKSSDKNFDKDVHNKLSLMDPALSLNDVEDEVQRLTDIEEQLNKMWRTGEIDVKPELRASLRDMDIYLDNHLEIKKRDAGTSPSDDPHK